ncbi:MAG: DUF11 domain-containing protein, partial [Caldilineaceae bacterium]|nr:DUF11 domain-containing protein [Caldilineaceae bacterium]
MSRQIQWRRCLFVAVFLFVLLILNPVTASADPFPPLWDNGSGPAVHFSPAPWPSEPADPSQCGATCGDWLPYTRFATSINDPRTQDPSNGGTRPQNYVNISSSCSDTTTPSIYYNLDLANRVVMFRWRVEQIAHTYATGPSAGSYGATDPWSSALWTVFFDIDGDGYRDLAAHLNGSSGAPATPVDRLVGIWGNVPSNQSLDYPNDPNIHLLGHNPTGFLDAATNRILNFQNSVTPTPNWPNGAAETLWDYGTTRARLITTSPCNEYFVDYQIPLDMLDATALTGPKVSNNTPVSMLFCTANSLNNPFQKDCALGDPWAADPNKPAPFSDFLTLDGGTIEQPIVDLITTASCGPTTLTADVKDALKVVNNEVVPSVTSVAFYYYYDVNGDGIANDGNSWTFAASATSVDLNSWIAQWNAVPLPRGQYLISVQAVDDASANLDGKANRTFGYYATDAELLAAEGTPPPTEHWHVNPDVTGAKTVGLDINACGAPPPFVSKSAEPTSVTIGQPVTFTLAVSNTFTSPLQVSYVTDTLPAGFVFGGTIASTLGAPTSAPAPGASGELVWSFAPPVVVNASSSATLVFTATAPAVVGTYANVATMSTSFTELVADPVQVNVGAPQLTIAKSANTQSINPGSVITYTITYANNSPVNVTGAVITDVVPIGLGNVTPLDGGSYNSGTRTLTWSVGAIASGDGPFTVRFA